MTWTRDLHLYTGLLLAPVAVIFAVSTILLNHAWLPWTATSAPQVRSVPLRGGLPEGAGRLATARWVAEQAGVTGELKSLGVDGDVLTVPVELPGAAIILRADLAASTVQVERRDTSLWERLITLHRTPGPHLVGFRGNWVWVQLWRVLVDGSVALLLFTTVSGIYLWLLIRSQRRLGLLCATGGLFTFATLVAALSL